MNEQIQEYISGERVCVLSGILPDGGSHSSTLHFSHTVNPPRLFFQTSRSTSKVKSLNEGNDKRASVVFGFNENKMQTLQMRGTIRIVSDKNELEEIYKIHYRKNPHAEKRKGPNTVFIEFIPNWSRYTVV